MERMKIGIIGCGNISSTYIRQLTDVYADLVELKAVADMDMRRARQKAGESKGQFVAMTVSQMLKDPQIKIIVNLTIPKAHFAVAMKVVKAGKSVYNEKPLTTTRQQAQKLMKLAVEKGVRVGGAPDTFLGPGLQTCIKLINQGAIGEPIAATAFMMCRGHETWHPSPEFYYQAGGGPMFDMGPYYMTALVALMGPVKRVSGSARITFPERTILSDPKKGQIMKVEVATHVAATLDFECGAIATVIQSFDIYGHSLPCIEVHGTRGSLQVPDPNNFRGTVRLKSGFGDWKDVPLIDDSEIVNRGRGVADMACAIQADRKHRASGELCFHVLDIMHAVHEASEKSRYVTLKSTVEKPAALTDGLRHNQMD